MTYNFRVAITVQRLGKERRDGHPGDDRDLRGGIPFLIMTYREQIEER